MDEESKSFIHKQKLREFSTIKPALQEMLKGFVTEKEKATTRNMKIIKGKSSSVKANIQ